MDAAPAVTMEAEAVVVFAVVAADADATAVAVDVTVAMLLPFAVDAVDDAVSNNSLLAAAVSVETEEA